MHKPGVAASKTDRALTRLGGVGCPPYGPGPNHAGVPGAGKAVGRGRATGARRREWLLGLRPAGERGRAPWPAGGGGGDRRRRKGTERGAGGRHAVRRRRRGARSGGSGRAGWADPSAPHPRPRVRGHRTWRRPRRVVAGPGVLRAAGSVWLAGLPGPAARRTRVGPWGPGPPSAQPARRSTAGGGRLGELRGTLRPARTPSVLPRCHAVIVDAARAAERPLRGSSQSRRAWEMRLGDRVQSG